MFDYKQTVQHDKETANSRTEAALWLQRMFNENHVQHFNLKLENLIEKHQAVCNELKQEQQNLNDANEMISKLNENINELNQTACEMKLKYENDLLEMNLSYENKIENERNQFINEKEQIENIHVKKLFEMNESFEISKKELNTNFQIKLDEKEKIVTNYQMNFSISNEEHQNALNVLQQKSDVLNLQLKEAEDTIETLEAKVRKMGRENQFLKEELNEVSFYFWNRFFFFVVCSLPPPPFLICLFLP